jgi:hypothetical protein
MMAAAHRLLLTLLAAFIALGPALSSGAQSNDADPNRPVAFPTPTEVDSGNSASGLGGDATWPYADNLVDLAAVVLPLDALPNSFNGYGEFHMSASLLSQFGGGLPDERAILATGFQTSYISSFTNGADDIVSIRVILFADERQLAGGFALFENDEAIAPNAEWTDAPALDGVGDAPGEVTTGLVTNVDGSRTQVYSVTFSIGPMLITVDMQSPEDHDLDTELIDELAAAQATRAAQVLRGRDLDGIDPALPGYILWTDKPFLAYEGFTSVADDYLLATMTQVPDGLLSAYSLTYGLRERADDPYPYLSMVVASFDSEDALQAAFDDPGSLMSGFPNQEEIDSPKMGKVDNALAFTYTLPDVGPGARIFVQIGTVLFVIDVQGTETVDEAVQIVSAFGGAQADCILGKGCAIPTDLPAGTIFDISLED